MKLLARRCARVPQSGEIVMVGLRETVRIRAVRLMQPAAPRFYEVTDEHGAARSVMMGGPGGIDAAYAQRGPVAEKNLSSSPMVEKPFPRVGRKPRAAVGPALAIDSGLARIDAVPAAAQLISNAPLDAGHRTGPAQDEAETLDGDLLRQSIARDNASGGKGPERLEGEHRAVPPAESHHFEAPSSNPMAWSPPRRGRPGRPRLSVPSSTWLAAPIAKEVHAADCVLTFDQARAHAALDEARAAKYDRSEESMERYFAAIELVNRVDPGFYLGRIKPMKPLARGESYAVCIGSVLNPQSREAA